MKLAPIQVPSSYGDTKHPPQPLYPLPKRFAQLASDAAKTIPAIQAEFADMGVLFRLTDAYRSTEDQEKAHNDYVMGRKKAYSPPAGQSFHEAGRAIDVDLATMIAEAPEGYEIVGEDKVREVLKRHGWIPISEQGNPHRVDVKESWHFEF